MADPQVEDGFIQIANEVAEALCRHRISGREWQVLWVIIRKTWGFKKKMDRIALSQFADLTGMIRVNCQQTLSSLAAKNIILKVVTEKGNSVTEKGNTSVVSYGFNKNYDTWKLLPKKVTVTENSNKLLPKKVTTKEKKEIEISKKKISLPREINPDIKKFIDWWFEEWQKRFGEKYLIQGAKEGNIIKRLLKAHKLEKLMTLAIQFFDSDDEFIQKSGFTIGIFSNQIHKLVVGPRKKSSRWASREEADKIFDETVGKEDKT